MMMINAFLLCSSHGTVVCNDNPDRLTTKHAGNSRHLITNAGETAVRPDPDTPVEREGLVSRDK